MVDWGIKNPRSQLLSVPFRRFFPSSLNPNPSLKIHHCHNEALPRVLQGAGSHA
jgi:hypothetical protein